MHMDMDMDTVLVECPVTGQVRRPPSVQEVGPVGVRGCEWGAHMLVSNVDLNSVRSASNNLTCLGYRTGNFLLDRGTRSYIPA